MGSERYLYGNDAIYGPSNNWIDTYSNFSRVSFMVT